MCKKSQVVNIDKEGMTGAQFLDPRAVITGATGGGCGRKKIRERTTEAAATVAVFLFHQQMVLILVVLVADTRLVTHPTL